MKTYRQDWKVFQSLTPYLSPLDFSNSPVWNIQLYFFPSLNGARIIYIFDLCISQSCKYYLFWLSSLKFKSWMDSNMFLSILCYLLTTDSFWPKVTLLFICVHLNKICYLAVQHFVFFKPKKNLPKLQYMKMNVTST